MTELDDDCYGIFKVLNRLSIEYAIESEHYNFTLRRWLQGPFGFTNGVAVG